MTTSTSNVGIPGTSTAGGPSAPEEATDDAESPAEEEPVEAPLEPAEVVEPEIETMAAEMKPMGVAGGDVDVGIVGNITGWWVVGTGPRGDKRVGPYGMMEAFTKANQLRGILVLQGKLRV